MNNTEGLVLILLAFNIIQNIMWYYERKALCDRIMSRDITDYKSNISPKIEKPKDNRIVV